MKHILSFVLIAFISGNIASAQSQKKDTKNLQFFNRTELYYTFGLNETYPGEQTNSIHIKTVLGFSTPKIGFGFGIENGSYRSANGSYGASFNTIAFSGNIHFLAKPINDEGINFFAKGGFGYAVGVFNGYDTGINTEAATGFIFTNKKKRRYFLEGVYHYQKFDQIKIVNYGNPEIKSLGLGIGTWF